MRRQASSAAVVQPICDNMDVMRPCAYQPTFLVGIPSRGPAVPDLENTVRRQGLTDEVIIHGRLERDALLGVYLQHSSRISRTDDESIRDGGAPTTFNSVGSSVKAQEACSSRQWRELAISLS